MASLLELDEDALAPVLDGRQPGDVAGQRRRPDADLQLAFDVRRLSDSKRVNPTWAITSRSRWTRTTRSTAAIQGLSQCCFGQGSGRRSRRRACPEPISSLAAVQHLEFGLLDRLVEPLRRPLLAGLDLREDLFVGESLQGGLPRAASLALLRQVVEVFDVLEVVLPDLIDRLLHGLVPVGERDDAHDLREVGVAGRADQQPVRLVARLVDARARARVASRRSARARACRTWSRRSSAARPCTRSAPRLRTGRRWSRARRSRAARRQLPAAAVDEVVPVDVADMPVAAGPHEPDRDDRLCFLVVVDELALRSGTTAGDQPARAGRSPGFRGQGVLGDEPLGELPAGDARLLGRGRVFVVGRRCEEPRLGRFEQVA